MDFWDEMNKIMRKKLPDCYSPLLKYSRALVERALTISAQTHRENLQMCKNHVSRYQYAVGGEGLHRGYYCPSLIRDIVIGNCNRGRLVKVSPQKCQSISYVYGFCGERLLFIEYYSNKELYEIEYISYFGDKQIGYIFDNTMTLKRVSECIYRNKQLLQYLLVNANLSEPFVGIEKEEYTYDCDVMSSATMYSMCASNFCTHEKYIFSHDADGFLSSYQVVEYVDGKENENSYWKSHRFEVRKKRKV